MASPNGNHEERNNGGDLNIPPVAPSFEHKMPVYIAVQTQTLNTMAQTMVNVNQDVTKQVSLPGNHNDVTSDNHPVASAPLPPPFDKEKLFAMQAQVLQRRMQSNTSSPYNMEITKSGVPTGPVKKQVAEAWNRQRNKGSRGSPELMMERQHEDIKTPEICQCCEHYGNPCLQVEDSLMTAEERHRYHLDINNQKRLSTQDPVIKRVTQDEESAQTVNLDDWSISFKVYQPGKNKQSKKQNSEASQEKMELSQPMVDNSIQPSSSQPQPKVVQPPDGNTTKKNSDAQATPPRLMVKQKRSHDGHVKGPCFRYGKEGRYANKRTMTWSTDANLYCLKCGEDGHLASWCAKEDDYQVVLD